MTRDRKYDVRLDKSNNRLYIVLSEFLGDEDLEEIGRAVVGETKKLSTGFDMICDITDLRPISLMATNELKRAFIFAKNQGACRLILVADAPSMACVQFQNVLEDLGVQAEVVDTPEEAQRIVDTPSSPAG